MPNTPAGPSPIHNPDGTISAVVLSVSPPDAPFRLLRLWLPPGAAETPACGRFWMARCAEDTPLARAQDWSIYLRRPLPAAGVPETIAAGAGERLDLLLGHDADLGAAWLAARPPGSTVNLLGPFGRPFALPPNSRALLVLTLPAYAPLWLPAIHDMLDRGGRVTLVTPPTAAAESLRARLPLAVELRAARDAVDWSQHLAETVRWADHLCAALPASHYQPLADEIRRVRFRVDPGFAHVYLEADLACGFGACLACAVPLPDGGMTRACQHGPIFPLERVTV
ncbi:MAG: hypothetical protein IT329_06385 [Caldilineaceae bacterium]|nr:hypothetical protein [Caldilineaceae bacterium]